MAVPSAHEITGLLVDWSNGNKSALDRLIPVVYDELRRLAHYYLRGERPGHTLETTALVNEAYLRLIDQKKVRWQDRAHFFAVSAQLMRRILVDHARSRLSAKRGGGAYQVSLDESCFVAPEPSAELIALDDALTSLATIDPRKSRVVELRFFGGLSIEETAEVLEVSPRTIFREWSEAKAWLRREIKQGMGGLNVGPT